MSKPEKQEHGLTKSLTAIDGWAVGSGAMIGVTIFMVSGRVSGIAGPAASLGFAIGAVVVIFVGLCVSEVSSAFPKAGGAYVLPKNTMGGAAGDFLSFTSGWAMWGGQGLGPAVVAITCAQYLYRLLEFAGITVPIPDTIMAVIIVLIFTLTNIRGLGGGKAVQLASTFGVVGVMIIFIIWGLSATKPGMLTPFMPHGFNSVLAAASVCILSYGGWSTIPSMAEEFKEPGKAVPKSIVSSLLTCGILFSLFVLTMNGQLPGAVLAASTSPPVDAALEFTAAGAVIICLAGFLACVSTVNGLLMTGARIPFSMGRDGMLPTVLGRIGKGGAPYAALWLTAIGQIVLALSGLVNLLIPMIVFVTTVSWCISLISLYFLRTRRKDVTPEFRVPGYPVTLIIALAAIIYMATLLDPQAILVGCIWIALGIGCFFLFRNTGLKKFCQVEEAQAEAPQPQVKV